MTIRVMIAPPDEAVGQGLGATLEVRVVNDGPELVLLDEARTDGPLDEVARWRTFPEGVVVYDALEDEYRHHGVHASRAQVPVWSGLLPPRAAAVTLLRTRTLVTGRRRVRLTVRGHALPVEEALARVYAPAEALHGAVTVYGRVEDLAEVRGSLIARTAGLQALEAAAEVDLDVEADPAAAAALAEAGAGASLVARVRRLGGAWVALGLDGVSVVVHGERRLRVPAGAVAPAVWQHLDERLPLDPVLVMFRSDPARALRDAGALPLAGLDRAQQVLPPAALWDLLAQALTRRLTVGVEPHTAVADGLVVR